MFSVVKGIFSNCSRLKSTWSQPEGFNTGIKIYNCIVKDKVPLVVRDRNFITWYTCGPTVYDSAHVGHASCYVKLDIIQRILKDYFKLNLVTAMNITDIDDKIINESKTLNKSPIEVARYYEKEYLEDLDLLGVMKPDIVVRVTDNMSSIVKFIKKLVDNGNAYKTEDGSVYFDLDTYKTYGKLQNIGVRDNEMNNFKRTPSDFALWKSAKIGEPYWDSPFGPGRPGWHIECSALAGNLIGSTIDIHAGGIDLRFPHHENEEAQSCAYFSKNQWVNYWVHTGHLHAKDSEKMSKSLKNSVTIRDMLKVRSSNVFRMACLMTHYRNNMEYSDDVLINAQNLLEGFKNFIDDCNAFLKGQLQSNINNDVLLKNLEETIVDVRTSLEDDFNTPNALKAISLLMATTNKMLHTPNTNSCHLNHSFYVISIFNFVVNMFQMFGVDLVQKKIIKDKDDYEDVVDILIKFRQKVREVGLMNKNEDLLQLCDFVRDELKNVSIYVKDHGKMSSWSR